MLTIRQKLAHKLLKWQYAIESKNDINYVTRVYIDVNKKIVGTNHSLFNLYGFEIRPSAELVPLTFSWLPSYSSIIDGHVHNSDEVKIWIKDNEIIVLQKLSSYFGGFYEIHFETMEDKIKFDLKWA